MLTNNAGNLANKSRRSIEVPVEYRNLELYLAIDDCHCEPSAVFHSERPAESFRVEKSARRGNRKLGSFVGFRKLCLNLAPRIEVVRSSIVPWRRLWRRKSRGVNSKHTRRSTISTLPRKRDVVWHLHNRNSLIRSDGMFEASFHGGIKTGMRDRHRLHGRILTIASLGLPSSLP